MDSSGIDDIQRVRDASDIVRVIGEHIELKARGKEYVCLCPFHDDKKPSMTVVPQKQIYKCFSCGAGGDVYEFVKNYHQMTFGEAIRYLADRAGVKLQERHRKRTSNDNADSVTKSVLIEANELAERFFKSILRHAEHGSAARELIEKRGISKEMVDAFHLGASPDMWDGLRQFLESKGHKLDPFMQLGLLKASDRGQAPYDAQRNRLVFPIRDQIGRVIAFGGRRINDEDEPKYINSSESPVFDKSSTLFGLDLANRAIQREGVAVIAEGYTDVIACHQAGITNTVATLGTALTTKHATVLQRLCHTVVFLFDGDEAGQKAADRAAEVFLTLPIDAKIATLAGYTDAKDPDELLKQECGADVLREAIAEATELLEYRLGRLRSRLDTAGAAETERAIREEFRTLGQLGLASADKVRWQFVIRRLSELSGLTTDTVAELVREGGKRAPRLAPVEEEPQIDGIEHRPHRSVTAEILGCMLSMPERWIGMDENEALLESECRETRLWPVFEAMRELAHGTGRTDVLSVVDRLRSSGENHTLAIELERDVSRRHDENTQQMAETLNVCFQTLRQHASTVEAKPASSTADRLEQIKAQKGAFGPNTRILPRVKPH